jgi:hypothetical protein
MICANHISAQGRDEYMKRVSFVVVVVLALASTPLVICPQTKDVVGSAMGKVGKMERLRQSSNYQTMLDMTFPEFSGSGHHALLVWLLVGYIICHGFGQGAVVWVYISEVFPNIVRAKGQTLGSSTHWIMAMIVSWTFPILAKDAGQPSAGLPFAFFAVMMVVQFFVVLFFFPETKRVSLEDMEVTITGSRA